MNKNKIRVRFAPAPTGIMHLGNIRTALMNYLFAKQHNGTFILRIEDTDAKRNFDPEGINIIEDLAWLGITHDEGPGSNTQYGPYFQSKRNTLYQEKLLLLQQFGQIYRCFCTSEMLEKKRARQRALKQPPRYDRTCLAINRHDIQERLDNKTSFIWRFKLDHDTTISINDLAHGTISFDMKHFSDFPLTRHDGSFTFMFANFVDDWLMNITHIFRGEDHQTNSAGQAALYQAFSSPLPTFWHMPILTNREGKKLSKRDFGFSLRDLKSAGFIPEAIINYLAIIGSSWKQEIMPLQQLITEFDFDHLQTTGQIKYDVEKLQWINHKWIELLDSQLLLAYCQPLLQEAYPEAKNIDDARLSTIIQLIKTDLVTTTDIKKALQFYFETPNMAPHTLADCITAENAATIQTVITNHIGELSDHELFVQNVKADTKKHNIALSELFSFLRTALTGHKRGPGIAQIITILGTDESKRRIEHALQMI